MVKLRGAKTGENKNLCPKTFALRHLPTFQIDPPKSARYKNLDPLICAFVNRFKAEADGIRVETLGFEP
jgi:hypothetical protein